MALWNMKGIQRRWMFNNLGMVTLILLCLVAAFSFITGSNYYSSMQANLKNRASVGINSINSYQSGSRIEYLNTARDYVKNFDNTRIELQLLEPDGVVDSSSYILTITGSSANTPDVSWSSSNKQTEYWMGENPQTNERILSVTSPLIYHDQLVGMFRYTTSLQLVDRQVLLTSGIAIAIAAAILALIYFSNYSFVRSIVEPVVEITDIAKRISAGSYGIQVEQKPGVKIDDEIGALTEAINNMSRSIKMAENMKSEFIASVSHELRTPLTAINGWAETIMNGETRDEEDVRKGMGIIASEAKRLTTMVEELLEFSRIEDGRFTLSIEPMDIKAELEDAVYTYREFFASEGITLTHSDCEQEFLNMSGDPDRLRQVFSNLLDNAAKHGGSGKKIETAISPDEDGNVLITIRDHGPGIPKDELPRVKYKFYKGSSTSRGSGIGLAVCEEIISRHNGTLVIDNAEDGGCLVSIHLPYGT